MKTFHGIYDVQKLGCRMEYIIFTAKRELAEDAGLEGDEREEYEPDPLKLCGQLAGNAESFTSWSKREGWRAETRAAVMDDYLKAIQHIAGMNNY